VLRKYFRGVIFRRCDPRLDVRNGTVDINFCAEGKPARTGTPTTSIVRAATKSRGKHMISVGIPDWCGARNSTRRAHPVQDSIHSVTRAMRLLADVRGHASTRWDDFLRMNAAFRITTSSPNDPASVRLTSQWHPFCYYSLAAGGSTKEEFLRMCDYSLLHVKSRSANVGDSLTTHNFGTGTRGFAAPEDLTTAVCILPGTELAFSREVTCTSHRLVGWGTKKLNHKTAIFRQIHKETPHVHHDALEFPDGEVVLLTDLNEGQEATVLQLPAQPTTAAEAAAQTRVATVG
jgi:hypothetical protein